MPAHKRRDNPITIEVRIPADVLNPLNAILNDPVRGRLRHGARSKLITDLIRRYLVERAARQVRTALPTLPENEA